MKLLLVFPYYPHTGHPFSGSFNEKTALALRKLCEVVEVLVPRPYVPPLLSRFSPRWASYAQMEKYEVRNGMTVYRPAYIALPHVGSAFCHDQGAFLCCLGTARRMHRRVGFDCIMSFDLFGAGGLALRLAKDLGIAATGWATGSDLARRSGSDQERVVLRALDHLDLVFYQSCELFDVAAKMLGLRSDDLSRNKHIVLSRGIPEPPSLPRMDIRKRLRAAWGVEDDQVLVLNIGRVVREKGVFELLEAISLASSQDPRVSCVIVGSNPAYDESAAVQRKLNEMPGLRGRVRLLPGCDPDRVAEYLCAADIFAFSSHQRYEGMPNSLLEAMAMAVPAIAFGIPPVLELEGGKKVLIHVPPFDITSFSKAILKLADSPEDRLHLGRKGERCIRERFLVRKNMAIALRQLERVIQEHHTSNESTFCYSGRTHVCF